MTDDDDVAWQVIAKGMMTGQHAYLRSGWNVMDGTLVAWNVIRLVAWNVMDGTLVAVSLFDVFISVTTPHGQRNSFGILRVFRLLRTLRPLRPVPQHTTSSTSSSTVLTQMPLFMVPSSPLWPLREFTRFI